MRSLYLLLPKCKHEETLSIGNFFSHRSRNKSAKGKVSTSGFFNRPNSGWAAISAAFLCGTTLASTELYQIRVKCPTIFSFVALSNIEIFRFVVTKLFFYSTQFPFLDEKKKLSFYFFNTTPAFQIFSIHCEISFTFGAIHSRSGTTEMFFHRIRQVFVRRCLLPRLGRSTLTTFYHGSTAKVQQKFYPAVFTIIHRIIRERNHRKKVFFNFFTIFPCNTLTFCISFFSLFLLLPHFICH